MAAALVATAATAQPTPPPPSDAELRAATAPEVVRSVAAEVVRVGQELSASPAPVRRVELLAARWEAVSSLADSVAAARDRPTTRLDPEALADYARLTGHAADDPRWALRACVEGIGQAHVRGPTALRCLMSVPEPYPYYLQLAEWSRPFAEGSEAETLALYDRTAACAAGGNVHCRVALSAMQIELRDPAAAIATTAGLTDVGARTNHAIAVALSGDRPAGFAALAAILADHPDAALAAFAYAHFTHLYVRAPVPEPQRTRALHAAALYLCHADPAADLRHYEFRVRAQAFEHTVVFSDWTRPVLPTSSLPDHPWRGHLGGLPPRFTCEALTRAARATFAAPP